MNKQKTKNQHYVPRCLLKHFCWDEKINIYDLERTVVRHNQSVKKVFSQNYFYGKDNVVESFMAERIEAPVSRILEKIIDGNFKIDSEDLSILGKFILSLYYRTPKAIEGASSFTNSMIESIVSELLSLNGYDPAEASSGHFDFYQDRLASFITFEGVLDAALLSDLKYHIIKNETSSEFYISDHPVFIYNWFYRDLEDVRVTSLASIGLQIFLPLSPQITLCLYDSKVYKYGQRSSVSCISNDDDIEILNSLQVINSDSIIGFYSKENETHIKQLYERYKNIKLHQYESGILSTNKENEGEIRSRHFTFRRQAKLEKMPSFIKLNKRSKDYVSSYQERYPDLSAIHMNFKRLIHE